MTEKQFEELTTEVKNSKNTDCLGFGSFIILLIILIQVLGVPDKSDIRQIIQEEVQK